MKKLYLLVVLSSILMACAPSARTPTPSPSATEVNGPALENSPSPSLNDSSVTPASVATPQLQISGTTTDTLNIRAGPGINYAILGQLKQGEGITIIGKSKDGLWWQINRGWVSATYVQVSGDTSAIPIGTPRAAPTP